MAAKLNVPLIVMGVSGSGKSTVGRMLSNSLESKFIDGDDLHPRSHKDKMATGAPLDDDDRTPWLNAIADQIQAELTDGNAIIVACSALKRRYRTLLTASAPSVVFVHLDGARALISDRQTQRDHEYMPNSLLDSQFATLEPLQLDERGIVVDLNHTPEEIVQLVTQRLAIDFPVDSVRPPMPNE